MKVDPPQTPESIAAAKMAQLRERMDAGADVTSSGRVIFRSHLHKLHCPHCAWVVSVRADKRLVPAISAHVAYAHHPLEPR